MCSVCTYLHDNNGVFSSIKNKIQINSYIFNMYVVIFFSSVIVRYVVFQKITLTISQIQCVPV